MKKEKEEEIRKQNLKEDRLRKQLEELRKMCFRDAQRKQMEGTWIDTVFQAGFGMFELIKTHFSDNVYFVL